jgi:D-alanyl-D-alanine endopeptidase (penicillin-binding protein 7)
MKRYFLACCLPCLFLTGTAIAEEKPIQIANAEHQSATAKSTGNVIWQTLNPAKLQLKSASALVMDSDGNVVYSKDAREPRSIASITKLMTAMVILDASLPMQEPITVTKNDRDQLRGTGSRLKYGATLPRETMIRLALMSSENRAATALARTYPGGTQAFIRDMNKKAKALEMNSSHFADPAGLDAGNTASARDVAKMVRAGLSYPLIHKATTTRDMNVFPYKDRGSLRYINSNRLMRNENWTIYLSKTGYINEAGRCLAMQAEIVNQPLIIVLLNSFGKLTPLGDSNRIRKWIEQGTRG